MFRGMVFMFAVCATATPSLAQGQSGESGHRPPGSGNFTSSTVRPSSGRSELRQPLAFSGLEYRIAPGDVLQVDVWKEPDASTASATVRPDGKISIRILGEVAVAQMTPVELETLLTTQYRELIRDARVTIVVKEINSQKIYVVGEVKKEGPIRLQGPLTVLQALAEAGGISDYAKRKKIHILRTVQGRQYMAPFDYDAVVRGLRMDQNVLLLPGDTVVVPR